jgi:peptidoglycan hydrolase-like amidase
MSNKLALLMVVGMSTALSGCMTVPATKISFNKQTNEVAIKSPKDVELKDLKIRVENGTADISIGSYKSANNADVVRAIAEFNRESVNAVNDRGEQLLRAYTGAGGKEK